MASSYASLEDGVIVQNHYYCDPGGQDDVLALRRQANRCRVELGLPPGRILQRVGGSDDAPWLVWQHRFDDLAAWRADLDVLAESAEFAAIRERQSAALSHFDRVAYRSVDWRVE